MNNQFRIRTPHWSLIPLSGGLAGLFLFLGIFGCKSPTAAFQTISATETAVSQANLAYLDSVVVGHTPTNSVPTVEKAFNDTQMALRAAAAVASGGGSAAVPASVLAQATQFTNTIKAAQAAH